MEQAANTQNTSLLPDNTLIGLATLTVADLTKQVEFYTTIIGCNILARTEQSVILGAGKTPLIILTQDPEAFPRPLPTTGLYHIAIRVPTRANLGYMLQHFIDTGYPLGGASDHLVSEALYLSDPEGNGLEIYRDRPRATWPRSNEGGVQMGSEHLDANGILAAGRSEQLDWHGLPEGTDIGHMHLQIAELNQAETFYCTILGFSLMQRWHGALFVSAGGYHHHLGLNTWQSRGASPAPAHATGLRLFTLTVPDEQALAQLEERLRAAQTAFTRNGTGITVSDPWKNTIIVTAQPLVDSQELQKIISSSF
ncbi:VOC family protein [Tengunoibacter tsumagoiensis]|uniref:Catechol-2,3-dioxygenase n=1 Tax=Tengunoibacter tsumagoiensis TaxID=2014871 RepID=A0A402A5Q2_9CHLR|nr:VOC family protein [Tengunoibacter tsumagoiensis]GCE14473.1 catechol-2,3-dioxygenase [Tengunoibacter tsumagoiensis]